MSLIYKSTLIESVKSTWNKEQETCFHKVKFINLSLSTLGVFSRSSVEDLDEMLRSLKFDAQYNRGRGTSIIAGGHIFIYSCYAQLISFEIEIKILKSIVFTVCEQECMNMCPPPPSPNYRSSAASANIINT